MRLLIVAGLLAGLAGCATDTSTDLAMARNTSAGGTPPTSNVHGLLVRFFRCDDGAAFTTENYPDGRFRLKTREVGYDLKAAGDVFVGEGVTFRRSGASATLEGAAGGPYLNCVQQS